LPLPNLFSENLIDISAMPDIMNFHSPRAFIDPVNNPVTLGSMR
jgi:hypothetical protein